MSGVERDLAEGSGPCGTVAEPNQGQIQMAAEHLAISVGAKMTGRQIYPRSAVTSRCNLGCGPCCRGCTDVDMPQLRHPKASECIDGNHAYDPFTLLVDGKYKPNGEYFPPRADGLLE